ncbi:MAG: AtpZ/AtpI family protein [Candidatus Bipolaricaulota bacterium]
MPKRKKEDGGEDRGWKTALSTVAEVGQLGFTFAAAILICVGFGYWMDNFIGTERLFKLIFLVLGVLAGGWAVYGSLKRFFQPDDSC